MKNIKKKALMMSVLIGVMSLAACNGGNNSDSAAGSSKKGGKSSSEFSISSVAPVELPKYEVVILDAEGNETSKQTLEHGTALTKPADPSAPAGQKFYGWMNTKNGGQIWDFDATDLNVVMQDVELKPLFVNDIASQDFEAELCPAITEANGGQGMDGATYSGGAKGKQLINRAYDGEYKASGAYYSDDDGNVSYAKEGDENIFAAYVHFMYAKGDTLTWNLVSSAADDSASLFMRLGGEYAKPDEVTGEKKYSFTDDEFQIKVNGVALKYGTITMHNIPDTGSFLTFQDFFVNATFALKEGNNTIEMVVNNDINLFSTIAAAAPCVDSVKVLSSSTLSWPEAKLANLERD